MWFKKKTVKLSDSGVLIGFTDMHSHLLWGVDDGSKSAIVSQQMIDEAVNLGFKKVFCTPHVMANLVKNSTEYLRNEFAEKIFAPSGLEIGLAAEYMLDEAFLMKLESGDMLTYDGNLLLIEMSHLQSPPNLKELIFEIVTNGYTPLLAHPERYASFLSQRDYYDLKNKGCLFQLNLLSLGDVYGGFTNKMAHDMLRDGLYDYMGSDMHNVKMLNMLREIQITSEVEKQISMLVK